MPFISEVSAIFIQRLYTGLITLRNQTVTPIRMMGRRVIELYDALISGNDWEVTPYLSLKRRAGHTAYVTLNFPALNMDSWKSNTMGTIPVIDTTGDVEYVNSGGTTTVITTKTVTSQIGMLGIGNYFYMGDTAPNLKWDGPTGSQGVTNWGITASSGATGGIYGPQTAGTGANYPGGSGPAWVNPGDVTAAVGYATITIPNPNSQSQGLEATNFNFVSLSIPMAGSVVGIQVSATAFCSSGPASPMLGALLLKGGTIIGAERTVLLPSVSGIITFGSSMDLWGTTWTVNDLNQTGFGVVFYNLYTGVIVSTTDQVRNVQITVYISPGITVTPTGSGSFSAVNGYIYVTAYGNSVSGEISNASPPSNNTGPFTNKAYVAVPVVASTDPQVNQIRVYRTTDSGGGNQFFEIQNSPFPNTTATIQDSTPDTSLQVTSQAEINLGNTPPPAGLINLEWFAGRMWGSTNNLLWASTGPETISGTAPNSNWNPLFQFLIPGVIVRNVTGPSGMLVFTQDDCYIVRGTDITNYTINEFVKDFGIRSYNAVDTDGTNLYVFTSDRQFIQVTSAGANDIGLPIADQLAKIDPNSAYVKVNRYGLDSIVRILDTVPQASAPPPTPPPLPPPVLLNSSLLEWNDNGAQTYTFTPTAGNTLVVAMVAGPTFQTGSPCTVASLDDTLGNFFTEVSACHEVLFPTFGEPEFYSTVFYINNCSTSNQLNLLFTGPPPISGTPLFMAMVYELQGTSTPVSPGATTASSDVTSAITGPAVVAPSGAFYVCCLNGAAPGFPMSADPTVNSPWIVDSFLPEIQQFCAHTSSSGSQACTFTLVAGSWWYTSSACGFQL